MKRFLGDIEKILEIKKENTQNGSNIIIWDAFTVFLNCVLA